MRRSKRFNLVVVATILALCIADILFYAEYGTKSLVDELVTNPDKFEEVVDSIAV